MPNVTLDTRYAFPTAEGFGRNSTGGRGGQIIHVTNLNDSGSGSLREALEVTQGPRTIVFDVGGDINLLSNIQVGNGSGTASLYNDFTIAGETAPSPGITLKDFGIIINSENVISRYITIRPTASGGAPETEPNAILIRNWPANADIMQNLIFDHLTMSHAGNENFGLGAFDDTYPIRNVTLQNCMLGKVNGDGDMLVGPNIQSMSIFRNYFHHEQERTPLVGYGYNDPLETKEIINNVIYATYGAVSLARGNYVDVISNVYSTPTALPAVYNIFSLAAYGYIPANGFPLDGSQAGDGGYFVDGNIITPGSNVSVDDYNAELLSYNQPSRIVTNSTITSWETVEEDIVSSVLTTVGNSLYRDALDQEMIDDYSARTGDYSIPSKPNKASSSRAPSFYSSLLHIPETFVQAHNITSETQVKTNWDFGSYTVTNNAGYTAFEMYLAYVSGDLAKLSLTALEGSSNLYRKKNAQALLLNI